MFSDFFGGRMQAKRIEIENSCPIDIGRSVAGAFVADFIARQEGSKSALIVTDREVAGLYLKEITEAFSGKNFSPEHIIIDGSPSSKTLDELKPVFERIIDLNCSYLIALGGGGVIDVASFAASIIGSGVQTILIPTSLLSMLESVAASYAFLHFQNQNDILKVAVSPVYAAIDVSFLKTLPRRYFANGLAQIIRYGLVENPALLHALASAKDIAILVEEGLRSGARIRKTQPHLLAFGKDIADAIECHFRFMKYTTGEALALSLLSLCHTAALHKLYEQLGLPVLLTEVTKETLLKRIAKSLEKRGKEVDLIRIGPERKLIVQRVSIDTAVRFYDLALSEICRKVGES